MQFIFISLSSYTVPLSPCKPFNPGNPLSPFTPGKPGGPGKPGSPFAPGFPGIPGKPSRPNVSIFYISNKEYFYTIVWTQYIKIKGFNFHKKIKLLDQKLVHTTTYISDL